MSIKVIISDADADHAANVMAALLIGGGGSLLSGEVEIRFNGFANDIEYARSVGAVCVVRSTPGFVGNIATALNYYRSYGILTVMPAGSNTPGEIFESNGGANLPVIVVTGAGDAANETADDIEFFSPDPVTIEPDLSSYSNGDIAGRLFKIKTTLICSWWEARYRARVTASENSIWHETNGYGIIDVAGAIAFSGSIPADPYSITLGAIGTLSGGNVNASASLTLQSVSNATQYIIEKNTGSGWNVVSTQAGLSFTTTLTANVPTQFRYKATDGTDETSYSNIVSLNYFTISPIFILRARLRKYFYRAYPFRAPSVV